MRNTFIWFADMASSLKLMTKSLFSTTFALCCLVFCLHTPTVQTAWAGSISGSDNYPATPSGNLNVFVFRDINRNGIYNGAGGETPIQGWQIKVFAEGANTSSDAPLYMGTTDVGGNALFSGIPQGNYIVCEEMRSHWDITAGTICRNVTVGSGTTNVLYSNFENRTYTFHKVSTPATNAVVYFDWTLQDLNGAAPGDVTVVSDGNSTVVTGGPSLLTVTELVPAGMKLVRVVCNGQDMTITNNGFTFDTRPAETDMTCTFYNEPICTPPSISDQPDAVTGCAGAPASFTVAASGIGTLSYQWQENGINLANGGVYSNVTTATLNISNTAGLNGKQYKVIVTSDNGTPDVTNNDCSTTSTEVTLTVGNDAQAPTVACPANMSVSTAGSTCASAVAYSATASDNCTASPTLQHSYSGATSKALTAGSGSGSTFNKGTTTVTLRAADGVGLTQTCTFRVIVNDTQAPTIACPSVAAQNAGAGQCSAVVSYPTPTASDNCAPVPTVVRISGPASGSTFPIGNTFVTWRAIDGAGRSSTCSFAVAVADNQAPVITCPQNIVQNNPANACNTPIFYTNPTATDNCGVNAVFLVSGLASGSTFPVGTTVNTWRANDVNGLSATCSFSVTVVCGQARPGLAVDRTGENGPANGAAPIGDRRYVITPNPAGDLVQIAWEGDSTTPVYLTIFDAQGRLVWAQTTTAGAQTLRLDVSKWASGVYNASLYGEDRVEVKRLVVTH